MSAIFSPLLRHGIYSAAPASGNPPVCIRPARHPPGRAASIGRVRQNGSASGLPAPVLDIGARRFPREIAPSLQMSDLVRTLWGVCPQLAQSLCDRAVILDDRHQLPPAATA